MGVPKFFRWISERYPLLNHSCDSGSVPIIDNLYLDMNGVIHNCSHGAGTDVNTRMTEDEVRRRVWKDRGKPFRGARPFSKSCFLEEIPQDPSCLVVDRPSRLTFGYHPPQNHPEHR